MGINCIRKRTIWLTRFFLVAFTVNFFHCGESQLITRRFKGSDIDFEKIKTALRGFNPPIAEEKTKTPFIFVVNKSKARGDFKLIPPTRSPVQLKGKEPSLQPRKSTSCVIKVKTNPAPPQKPLKPSKLPTTQVSVKLRWAQGFYPKGLVVRFSLSDKRGNLLGEKDFPVPEDPKWSGIFSLKDLPVGSLVKISILERDRGKMVSPTMWQLKRTDPFGPLKAGKGQEMVVEIFRTTTDIALYVTNEEKCPVPNLKVILLWFSEDKRDGKPEKKIAMTNEKGLALFQKVPLGAEVEYFLESEDWEIVDVEGDEIKPGKTATARLVVAQTKKDIAVQVVSTKQRPIPNLNIRLEWRQEGKGGELTAETDEEGKAIFPKIPVRAELTCFVESEIWDVVGKKDNPFTLVVRPTQIDLSVQCLDERGEPVKNLPITLVGFQKREGQIVCVGDLGERITDGRGFALFEKAPTNLILQIRSLDPRWEVVEGTHQLPPYELLGEDQPVKVRLRRSVRALQVLLDPTPTVPVNGLKLKLFEVDPKTMKDLRLIEEREVKEGKATFSPQPIDCFFRLELGGENAINWKMPPHFFTICPEELKEGKMEIDRDFDYRPKRYSPHQEVVRIQRVLPIFIESEPSGAKVIYVYNAQKDQSEPLEVGEEVLGVTPVFLKIPYNAKRLFLQKGYGLQGMVDLDALKEEPPSSEPKKVKVRLKCKKIKEIDVTGGISVNDPKSKVEGALGKPVLEKEKSGKPITVNGALVWKYPEKGLEVVLRNFSLTEREDWRVDVIRIVSEGGGSVEGHCVGEPVDKLLSDQDRLGLPEKETVQHSERGEGRVLHYVDGGIRFIIDTSTNLIKAIEIARSLEGLKEGIPDFAPPRKLRFYVEPFEDRSIRRWPLFAQTITEDLKWVIRQIPTYELVDKEEDADYLIRGWIDAESSGREGEEPVLDPERIEEVGSNYRAKYRDIDAQANLHIDLIDLNAIEAKDRLVWSKSYQSKRLKYRVYANPKDKPSKGVLERILLALIVEVATNPKKKEILEHIKRLIVILGIMAVVDRQFREWIGERIGARRPSIGEEELARLACLQLMMECVHELYSIRPLTVPIIAINRNSGEMEIPVGWREGITRDTEFILVNKEREILRERRGRERFEGEICRLKVVRVEEGRSVVKPDSKKPAEEIFRAPDPASGLLQARSAVPKDFKKLLEKAREERD